jgi:hypothetical protein
LRDLEEIKAVVRELAERRKDKTLEEKIGWYKRYWTRNYVDSQPLNKEKNETTEDRNIHREDDELEV